LGLSASLFTIIKIIGVGGRQWRPDTQYHVRRVEMITVGRGLFSVLSEPCHERPVQTYGVAHTTVRLIHMLYIYIYIYRICEW
jgi:hypothetical protein